MHSQVENSHLEFGICYHIMFEERLLWAAS